MKEVYKVCVPFHSFFKTCGPNRFFGVSATRVRLFLLAAVLSCCTGNASADIVPKITASAGETVFLPCNTTINGDVPTVEWTKEGLFPNIAFLYRDGCETFEMQNPVFRYRTNLIRHELHNGNLSMVISSVQPDDSGKYQCAIRRNKKKQVIRTLELFVGVVSEPKLTVVPGVGGGLTLQCEAKCWFPEPVITFLDNQGNEISAEDPRREENSPGCLTFIRRVTLQTATNRVTCRVHQAEINQTRDLEIYIPDEYLRSCTVIIVISVVVTIFIVTVTHALMSYLVKNCCRSEGGHKASVKGQTINQLTNEPKEHKPMPSSESSNDSTSSLAISNPFIAPTPKSPHSSNNPKPEASTTSSRPKSNSLSQTTEEDSEPAGSTPNPAPSSQIKRSSHDSSSSLSTNNYAALPIPPSDSKDDRLPCVPNIMHLRRTSRNARSQESEPLI